MEKAHFYVPSNLTSPIGLCYKGTQTAIKSSLFNEDMKRIFRFLFLISLISAFFLIARTFSFAETNCQPIYGGGQTCVTTGNVSVNKMVLNPQSNVFVDNLTINDPKFSPNQNVTFQISVTNNDGSVNEITVKDVFPQFVSFVSGPGSFDANTNTLTFDVNNIVKGQTQTFTVVGKISDASKFPFSSGTTCMVNQAIITADNGQNAQDNSQFCTQINPTPTPTGVPTTKGGLPVVPAPVNITTTPSTGPEALPLLALIPTGIAGLIFRKKSK